MAIFGLKAKKRKEGKSSNIGEKSSPYLKRTIIPDIKRNRIKKSSRFVPTSTLKLPSNKIKRIFAVILAIGIIAFIVYALFFSDYFLIKRYAVEEENTIIETNDTINNILEAKIGNNLVLLNEDELTVAIKTAQPEIDKIKVIKTFPDKVTVEFEKFPAVANITNISNGIQKKFVTDSQGFLIEENTENPNLPYIKVETTEQMQVRKTILPDAKRSAERLEYIIQAINLFEEKFGIKITYTKFKTREREIHLYTEKGFYVMIDMEKPIMGQIDKLKKALAKLDIYKESLLYIDLRISGTNYGKIIYKRK